MRVRVARQVTVAAPVYAAAPAHARRGSRRSRPRRAAAAADPGKHPGAVPSPMVGTAYLRPSRAARPSSRSARASTQGQTILIIEAMKTMNHIPAPKAGVVTAILVGNGQPVEFGEPLVIIE